jgi:uncharacterized protein
VRFWDASAVVPLLVEQPSTAAVRELLAELDELVLWWGTPVECASALARLRRERAITVEEESEVLDLLEELRDSSAEVQPSEAVRTLAGRLLRTHPLRSADALQLAAALVWAGSPRGDVLVTLDERLGRAARLEGFRVLPPS